MNIKKIGLKTHSLLFNYHKAYISFAESKSGKLVLKILKFLFTIGVLLILGVQLFEIGYEDILRNIPTDPLFLFLFIFTAIQLPFFEVWIYHIIWGVSKLRSLPILLLKNTYNKDVMGYSGEVYLFFWAKKYVPKSESEILKDLKDTNIISSFASTVFAISLLFIFFYTGQLEISDIFKYEYTVFYIILIVLLLVLGGVIFRFRKLIISQSYKIVLIIFGIHFFRLFLMQLINVGLFYLVIPNIPIGLCFTLIAGEIIISRVPFVPNRDLVYTSLSFEYLLQTNQSLSSEISSLILVKTILAKLISFVMFNSAYLLKKIYPMPELNISKETK